MPLIWWQKLWLLFATENGKKWKVLIVVSVLKRMVLNPWLAIIQTTIIYYSVVQNTTKVHIVKNWNGNCFVPERLLNYSYTFLGWALWQTKQSNTNHTYKWTGHQLVWLLNIDNVKLSTINSCTDKRYGHHKCYLLFLK